MCLRFLSFFQFVALKNVWKPVPPLNRSSCLLFKKKFLLAEWDYSFFFFFVKFYFNLVVSTTLSFEKQEDEERNKKIKNFNIFYLRNMCSNVYKHWVRKRLLGKQVSTVEKKNLMKNFLFKRFFIHYIVAITII